jgi:hypothetical protein
MTKVRRHDRYVILWQVWKPWISGKEVTCHMIFDDKMDLTRKH